MSSLNKNMKSMGRNLARAANQSGSSKVPAKYAGGGPVSVPSKPFPPSGAGKARGGKAQTKGKGFGGVY